MPWHFAEATHIGGRSEQQDRIQVFNADKNIHLAVVADGMGGHQSGAAAAQAVIDVATQYFFNYDASEPRTFLEDLCRDAHDAINAIPNTDQLTPGSTCVMLYVNGPEAYWVHVGDGRLYHFRGSELLSQTRDHSMVQFMLAQGRIEEGEASGHAMQNQVYMRLGGERPPEPDFGCLALESEDIFLLCTDGFWELVETDEVSSLLSSGAARRDIAVQLVERARDRGGCEGDNISLVLAQWTNREAEDESSPF